MPTLRRLRRRLYRVGGNARRSENGAKREATELRL
jgi:AbrB family looped-hinge helix DNA binding protein